MKKLVLTEVSRMMMMNSNNKDCGCSAVMMSNFIARHRQSSCVTAELEPAHSLNESPSSDINILI